MVTLSTKENVLQSDRVPAYVGSNRLYLKKGLQTSSRSIEIPTEIIKEQGNRLNRGTSIQPAQITVSMEDLAVDMDIEQVFADDWSELNGSLDFGAVAGMSGLHSVTTNSGVSIRVVGPTDNINCIIVSYNSGATAGKVRVGEGSPTVTRVSSSVIGVGASYVDNFAIGDSVIVEANNVLANTTARTVSAISGNNLSLNAGADVIAWTAASAYCYVTDTGISTTNWVQGTPNVAVKGVEVFSYNDFSPATGAALAGKSVLAFQLLSATGSTLATRVDSDNWRDASIDILMLYNDYDNDLLYTRYMQDCAPTSVSYNFTGDGNATQNYDFTSSKSIDFSGYVLRKSCLINSGDISVLNKVDLNAISTTMFTGAETPVAITANTSLNQNAYSQYLLKLTTTTSAGSRQVWTEVANGTSAAQSQYSYDAGTITVAFGSGASINAPNIGDRIEITYLCAATNVDSDDEYGYAAADFSHNGTPDAVTGGYQPLTINTSTFTNRVDGIESSTFSVAFNRDYFPAQGILAPIIKPSMVGTIDGSFTTKEGYSRTMNAITSGTGYSYLAANTQIDANKAAKYTNTKDVPLRIRLYDPADNSTIVKTVQLDQIQISSVTNNNSVSDDSSFEVSFSSKNGRILIDRY